MLVNIGDFAKTGDKVEVGTPIATLYSSKENGFDGAEERLLKATRIQAEQPKAEPLILDVVE